MERKSSFPQGLKSVTLEAAALSLQNMSMSFLVYQQDLQPEVAKRRSDTWCMMRVSSDES